jgi:hypothetical protein
LLQSHEEPVEAVNVTLPPVQNVVGPFGVIVAVGSGLTVTAVAVEVALQPLAPVTCTVKLPFALTIIDWVVALLLHSHEEPAEAVKVTLPPWQKVVGPPGVMVAVGRGLTVTTVGVEVPEQPPETVTLTVKLPFAVTVIAWVVALLLHK